MLEQEEKQEEQAFSPEEFKSRMKEKINNFVEQNPQGKNIGKIGRMLCELLEHPELYNSKEKAARFHSYLEAFIHTGEVLFAYQAGVPFIRDPKKRNKSPGWLCYNQYTKLLKDNVGELGEDEQNLSPREFRLLPDLFISPQQEDTLKKEIIDTDREIIRLNALKRKIIAADSASIGRLKSDISQRISETVRKILRESGEFLKEQKEEGSARNELYEQTRQAIYALPGIRKRLSLKPSDREDLDNFIAQKIEGYLEEILRRLAREIDQKIHSLFQEVAPIAGNNYQVLFEHIKNRIRSSSKIPGFLLAVIPNEKIDDLINSKIPSPFLRKLAHEIDLKVPYLIQEAVPIAGNDYHVLFEHIKNRILSSSKILEFRLDSIPGEKINDLINSKIERLLLGELAHEIDLKVPDLIQKDMPIVNSYDALFAYIKNGILGSSKIPRFLLAAIPNEKIDDLINSKVKRLPNETLQDAIIETLSEIHEKHSRLNDPDYLYEKVKEKMQMFLTATGNLLPANLETKLKNLIEPIAQRYSKGYSTQKKWLTVGIIVDLIVFFGIPATALGGGFKALIETGIPSDIASIFEMLSKPVFSAALLSFGFILAIAIAALYQTWLDDIRMPVTNAQEEVWGTDYYAKPAPAPAPAPSPQAGVDGPAVQEEKSLVYPAAPPPSRAEVVSERKDDGPHSADGMPPMLPGPENAQVGAPTPSDPLQAPGRGSMYHDSGRQSQHAAPDARAAASPSPGNAH